MPDPDWGGYGDRREQEIIDRIYPQIPSISVDYGIMEKSPDVKVIHGEFGWSDVGSWDNMGVLHPEDDRGNVACGEQCFWIPAAVWCTPGKNWSQPWVWKI